MATVTELGPGRYMGARERKQHGDRFLTGRMTYVNDIAPAGYDALDPEPGLPPSPLQPDLERTGFRRRS